MNEPEKEAKTMARLSVRAVGAFLFTAATNWFADQQAKSRAKATERAERREAEAWAEKFSKRQLTDLVAQVAMPEHLWRTNDPDYSRSVSEGLILFRAFVDAEFAQESPARRAALAEALLSRRYRQWRESPEMEAMWAAVTDAYAAERDEQAAANAAHFAAASAPHPNSREGMAAYAESSFRETGRYRLPSGRELSRDERVQLGLVDIR